MRRAVVCVRDRPLRIVYVRDLLVSLAEPESREQNQGFGGREVPLLIAERGGLVCPGRDHELPGPGTEGWKTRVMNRTISTQSILGRDEGEYSLYLPSRSTSPSISDVDSDCCFDERSILTIHPRARACLLPLLDSMRHFVASPPPNDRPPVKTSSHSSIFLASYKLDAQ